MTIWRKTSNLTLHLFKLVYKCYPFINVAFYLIDIILSTSTVFFNAWFKYSTFEVQVRFNIIKHTFTQVGFLASFK